MFPMPWDNASAPGAMIEVTDACNITCACCYKKPGERFKTLAGIERDIDDACRLRPLHTLSISGGEPTLHPDLCAVVALIKRRGLHAFLLTNGVLVDEALLARLRRAGLDSILFHVDPGQRRPDLNGGGVESALARLAHLARLAAATGLDVSASATLDADAPEQTAAIVDAFLASRELSFLFLARGITPESLYAGPPSPATTPESFIDLMRARHGLEPFSFIPDRTGRGTNWLSYFIPIVHDRAGRHTFKIRPCRADLALVRLQRRLSGRYVQKTKQNSAVTLFRLAVNGLATLRPWATLRFIARLVRPGARLRHKTIVYDHGPTWTPAGELSYCAYCSTAIVREGALVPCCMADYHPPENAPCR